MQGDAQLSQVLSAPVLKVLVHCASASYIELSKPADELIAKWKAENDNKTISKIAEFDALCNAGIEKEKKIRQLANEFKTEKDHNVGKLVEKLYADLRATTNFDDGYDFKSNWEILERVQREHGALRRYFNPKAEDKAIEFRNDPETSRLAEKMEKRKILFEEQIKAYEEIKTLMDEGDLRKIKKEFAKLMKLKPDFKWDVEAQYREKLYEDANKKLDDKHRKFIDPSTVEPNLVRVARRLIDHYGINRPEDTPRFLPCEIQYFSDDGKYVHPKDTIPYHEKWGDVHRSFNEESELYGDHTHWIIFVNKKEKYIVVAFRGTQVIQGNLSDLFSDASVFPHMFNDAAHGSGVHRGFWTRMHNQFPIIRDIINCVIKDDPSYNKIYVTGHSLGGALAQAFYMNWNTVYPESARNATRDTESALQASNWKKLRETALKFLKPTIPKGASNNKKRMLTGANFYSNTNPPPRVECVTFAAPAIVYTETGREQLDIVVAGLNKFTRTPCYNFIYHNDVVPQLPIKLHDKSFISHLLDRGIEYVSEGAPWFLQSVVKTLLNMVGSTFKSSIVSLMHDNFIPVAPFYRVVSHNVRLLPTTNNWKFYGPDELTEKLLTASTPEPTFMDRLGGFFKKKETPPETDFEASKASISDHSMINYIGSIEDFNNWWATQN